MPETTYNTTTELMVITCPHCAGVFGLSSSYYHEARRLGNFKQVWCCPYCKQARGFGKSQTQLELEQLQSKLAAAERTASEEKGSAEYYRQEAEHFRKSRDGVKGVLKKFKNRVHHGVCPCCQRSFENLRRHMASKHPEFNPSPESQP